VQSQEKAVKDIGRWTYSVISNISQRLTPSMSARQHLCG